MHSEHSVKAGVVSRRFSVNVWRCLDPFARPQFPKGRPELSGSFIILLALFEQHSARHTGEAPCDLGVSMEVSYTSEAGALPAPGSSTPRESLSLALGRDLQWKMREGSFCL